MGILFIFFICYLVKSVHLDVDLIKSKVWGPGLMPDEIVMPARYFFIQLACTEGIPCDWAASDILDIKIDGKTEFGGQCRTWVNLLNRKDGFYIARYKLLSTCSGLTISILHKGLHVGDSPYITENTVFPDECDCPRDDLDKILRKWQCGETPSLLSEKLKEFPNIDWSLLRSEVIKRFDKPHSVSLCHYIIKNNKVYRKCYGKYVGFNMFMDALLLSLTRKVKMPDMEAFINLGDWPLSTYNLPEKYPILSWCGSSDSYDIVMPTYDITESTLENMGRVSLDVFSVQGNTNGLWKDRIPKLFWRGRDSNKHRLDLIKLSRQHPDLINASLTNFFFYRDQENVYGPKTGHVSFFTFFDYKYQLAIDGTVAPYRMPYLLVGGSLVFKTDSKYYEHFYNDLKPNIHYVPIKTDISDLIAKIRWAVKNDKDAERIAREGQSFVNENLTPKDVFCYHMHLFNEFVKRTISPVNILTGMELVNQTKATNCDCSKVENMKLNNGDIISSKDYKDKNDVKSKDEL